MNPFDIYIAYILWGIDGKRRPIVIYAKDESNVTVFKITSQYQSKSITVRSKYLTIADWQQAGLDKPSYIDIGGVLNLPFATIDSTSIGTLSERDKQTLVEALEK